MHYLNIAWPNRDVEVFLGSNLKTNGPISAQICSVGNSETWGEHVHKMFEAINYEHILLIMPDFFISKRVDEDLLEKTYEIFANENLKYLALAEQSIYKNQPKRYGICRDVNLKGAYSLSLRVAFWSVSALKEFLLPDDSPWSFERSSRVELEDPSKWCYTESNVFNYSTTGALIRGSWTRSTARGLRASQLENFLGDRPVLDFKASVKYRLRTVLFRTTTSIAPDLVRMYNLRKTKKI